MNSTLQMYLIMMLCLDPDFFRGTVFDSELSEDCDWQVIPSDFKRADDSDTDSTDKRNRHKSSQESIVFDEEYEIFGVQNVVRHSETKICPFCNKNIARYEQFIFTSCLNQYFAVHSGCCESYQKKSLEFRLYQFPELQLKCARVALQEMNQLFNVYADSKVFFDLEMFHPISLKPLIKLDHSSQLQYSNNDVMCNGIIVYEFNNASRSSRMYQPKKMYIPFLEGRFQLDLFIFEQSSLTRIVSIAFFYDMHQYPENENFSLKYEEGDVKVSLSCLLESKTIQQLQSETSYSFESSMFGSSSISVLHLKSLKCELVKFLKNKSLKAKNSYEKKSSIQQQCVVERQRFESFQEESDLEIDDLQSVEEIKGQVVQYITGQHGSRTIQKFLTSTTQQEIELLIAEMDPYLADLMIDPYANYIFGSLSQSCTPQQRYHILKKISPRMIEITCDKKGTHAVQALVSLINSAQEEDLIEKSIKDHIIQLTLDNQGTHLIKKIISRFSEPKLNVVFNNIMDKFVRVVNHQYGLCVLKDLMTRFKNNDDKKEILLAKLYLHIDEILQDPYGNYAVQHALEIYNDKKCASIIERILSKIVQLSIHKYSSNVVEKCILDTSNPTKIRFFKAVSQDYVCIELMKNKFGSFVLQKALNEADKIGYLELIASIKRNLQSIYTANIKQKWEDYLDSFPKK